MLNSQYAEYLQHTCTEPNKLLTAPGSGDSAAKKPFRSLYPPMPQRAKKNDILRGLTTQDLPLFRTPAATSNMVRDDCFGAAPELRAFAHRFSHGTYFASVQSFSMPSLLLRLADLNILAVLFALRYAV
jgi:hypothetical protein